VAGTSNLPRAGAPLHSLNKPLLFFKSRAPPFFFSRARYVFFSFFRRSTGTDHTLTFEYVLYSSIPVFFLPNVMVFFVKLACRVAGPGLLGPTWPRALIPIQSFGLRFTPLPRQPFHFSHLECELRPMVSYYESVSPPI